MIKCGKCKLEHETVDQVRHCFQVRGNDPYAAARRAYKPTLNSTGRLASGPQLGLIKKLVAERGVERPVADNLTVAQASQLINQLLSLPKVSTPPVSTATPSHRVEAYEGATGLPLGTYTLVRSDGTYRTFQVDNPKWADGKTVISYLSGPDNEYSYTSCAFASNGRVSLFKRLRSDGQLAADIQLLMTVDLNPAHERFLQQAEAYALRSGKCMRCSHKLTVPASLHRGLGPVCAGIEGVA